MGSQHLPSFTFYAILDPLVRPTQSIMGRSELKVERTSCVRACARVFVYVFVQDDKNYEIARKLRVTLRCAAWREKCSDFVLEKVQCCK